MLGIAPDSPASGAPQKMREHHFEREKQGRMTIAKVYSEPAGMQAEKSNGEREIRDFRGAPWFPVELI